MTQSVIVTLLVLTIVKSVPIIYAALGGVISERSGVINIGLEGMMVAGAFSAVSVSYATGSPIFGLVAGVIAGAAIGWLLGIAATKFKVDQIVAGIGINLICTGGAAYGLVLIFNQPGASKSVPALGGPNLALFDLHLGAVALLAFAFVCALGLNWLIYKTPWGLRVQACGENPLAVKSAGLDPLKARLLAVTISGALAGLGGAFLSIGELNIYSDGMTAGRGFIALAAVIFGRWTPFGATGAAIFFGFFEALQYVLQGQVSWLPADAMTALPYVAALVALAGITGRVRAPAADGVPF
ncbi:MAG: ABC transporter permease [Candidatus Eremiobacteraeota bacterium]|nr:ABC transporter permease [Candidatus Eremiobacteraeota bacterium]